MLAAAEGTDAERAHELMLRGCAYEAAVKIVALENKVAAIEALLEATLR